jgi:hypothetical protein
VQELQAPTVVVPHVVPVVLRLHAWVSVLLEVWQAPLLQV